MNERSFIFVAEMRVKDEQKEIAIREKAIEMIAKDGFDGLSMQKLAKAAGVSPATIYLYFENREDLLNQLFIDVQEKFTEIALKDFDPEMGFEEGLWLQWQNRLSYIMEYPFHSQFMEQFKNSPLVNNKGIHINSFKEAMQRFCRNAIERGELSVMPLEAFWAIAYGPFYALMKFHLNQKSVGDRPFTLTEDILQQTFRLVIKALKNNNE